MSETPETKETPAQEPEQPKEDPNALRMTAELDDARRRASIAEQQAAYNAGLAAQRQIPQQQSIKDPLDNYSANDLTMSPAEKKAALDQAIRLRAGQIANAQNANMEQRLATERAAMEQKFALDMVMAQRPELQEAKNVPNFGAAVAKARLESQAAGIDLSPAQLAMKAVQTYDQLFKPKTSPAPPFVEGGSRPDLTTTNPQQQVTQQSYLEKTYGQKPNSVRPMYDISDPAQMDALNMEYVKGKNEPLFKKGALSSLNAVNATRTE